MLEFSVDDVAPDAELGVRVLAEACAALNTVFVDNAEGPVGLEFRFVV